MKFPAGRSAKGMIQPFNKFLVGLSGKNRPGERSRKKKGKGFRGKEKKKK